MPTVNVENNGENRVVINLADGGKAVLGVGEGRALDLTDAEINSLKKTPGYTISGKNVSAEAPEADADADAPAAKTKATKPAKNAPAPVALPGADVTPPAAPAALPLPGTN